MVRGFRDERRPDFRFHENDGARLNVGKEAADGARSVVGQVAVAGAFGGFGMKALDLRATGGGGAGDPQGVGRVGLQIGVKQRTNGKKFADGDGMYPERIGKCNGKMTGEALGDVPAVGRIFARFPQKANECQRQQQGEKRCVIPGQGGLWSGGRMRTIHARII